MTTADPHQAAGYPPTGGPPGGFGGPPPGAPPGGGFGGPPGGFGGPPPGGAPPGGFGGPPPGGAPPGGFGGPPGGFGGPPHGGAPPGGFGGPPAGGFGGPPPDGGGFGGPPGGFGGPPPGGAPPGGFGGPPGQFGGPPGQFGGPPKKGSNLGLWIGLGCGGLLIIGIVIAVVVMFALRDKPRSTSSSSPTPVSTSVSDDSDSKPATPGSVKLEDVRFFTGTGTSSILHMVAEIKNTGSSSVGFPQAKVTLYDAANTAVSSSYCTTVVRILPGNENIPCYAIFSDVKSWKTWKAEVQSSAPFGRLADVKASEIEYKGPNRTWEPHTLTGKITNSGTTGAKSVWAIVGLYDKDGKISGVGSAPVAGNDLEPGSSGNFKVSIYSVASPVTRYVVTPVGYE